jgi:predicted nucleotide-binding protein with TIR-like domain
MVYALNLDEATLRDRYLAAYENGLPMTGGGRSIPSDQIDQVLVLETEDRVDEVGSGGWSLASEAGVNRTDDFIVGAPGNRSVPYAEAVAPGIQRDPTRVMIVHGRNVDALNAVRAFLQSLGLVPILWEDAIEETGEGSPHNLSAVTAAMAVAQAVVVIFTAEDEARLLPHLAAAGEEPEDFGDSRDRTC